MPQDDKVVYMKRFSQAPRGLAERYREFSDQRLGDLLNRMLDQVDDTLFDRAERAASSTDQSSYFTAMRQMRLQRRQLEHAFRDALRAGHQQASAVAEAPSGEQDLSLVDNERLEEDLAIESMVTRAKARSTQALDHLCQRLNHLEPGAPVNPDNLAVGPGRLCATFADVISPLQLDLQPRLVIYKLFERHVLSGLPTLYDELNRKLAEAGVLPVIDPRKPAVKAAPRQQVQPRPAPRPKASRVDEQRAGALLNVLKRLGAYGPPAAGGDATGGQGSALGVESAGGRVVSALSGLQLDNDGQPPEYVSSEQLKAMLRRQAGLEEWQLSAEDEGTIDIVSLLFDAMLDEPHLLEGLKSLIARLQIPTIKAALLDQALFQRDKHPARQLINEMARVGVGWADAEQAEKDPVYRRLETLVNDVLSHFRDDVHQLEQALAEFHAFMTEERERAKQIEDRTRQAVEGKARVDEARERVEVEIQRVIGDRLVPEVVRRLLDKAWSKVLFIALLKEGEDGQGWRDQLDVVDRLVWSVQPKASHDERKRLVAEIPGLLHELRSGMNAVMYNPVDMTRLFKELEREHIQVLTRPLARADELRREAESVAARQAELDAEREKSEARSAALRPYREQVDKAEIGTWFEFRQADGKAIRARLSMRLSNGERLIFVNRAGFKLADRRRDELADALRREQIMILDDGQLFDRALESVVRNLRDIQASTR
ncbi:MAG: DUF1631 domain-containing protein [Ectothiorhodospiraceae bacterium]|nr:DUF1631 domain-containing protein [Ectothiorhodospiraceae bacterium]